MEIENKLTIPLFYGDQFLKQIRKKIRGGLICTATNISCTNADIGITRGSPRFDQNFKGSVRNRNQRKRRGAEWISLEIWLSF